MNIKDSDEQSSPLLKKFIGLKLKKLNSDSLKNIITRARNMTKLTLPSGCSQNLKAEFQDPEKALEYSRRKNRIFDSYLQTELGKLNCSESPVKRPSMRKQHYSVKSQTSSPEKVIKQQISISNHSPIKRKQEKSQSIYSPLTSRKEFSSIDTFYNSNRSNEQSLLPPLVKSVPLYLDPFYHFPKRNTFEDEARIEKVKHVRMSSLDEVNKKCDDFLPKCKNEIEQIKNMQYIKKEQRKVISDYMDDFSDCLKMAKDQQTFEDNMSTRIYNRKLDKEFRSELEELRQNLLEVTKSAIEAGGQKIWRWKNTLFLANADRLINSVPTNRKP